MNHKLFDTSFYIAKNEIPYTLVIIDVQNGYPAAHNENLLTNLLKQIKKAKKEDAAILLVNMEDGFIGQTISCIWDAVYDYTYFAQVGKTLTDGSGEILKALKKHRFLNKNKFKVGGIYANICVSDTVNGLSKRLPEAEIEVLAKCCYTDYTDHELAPIESPFDKIESKQVEIIF